MSPEILIKSAGRPPIRPHPRRFTNNESRHLWNRRLTVFIVHSIVSNQRVGHGNKLTSVGGIRQDLLITRHRSVKHDLSESDVFCPEEFSIKSSSIFEKEVRCVIQVRLLGSECFFGRLLSTLLTRKLSVPVKGSTENGHPS
tara:strand:+ start:896 stop:1321 length:426 start_codon:yes stop_codon:yes gene_type:complete